MTIFDDVDSWFNGTSQKTKKSKGAAGGKTTRINRVSKTSYSTSNVKKAMQSMTGTKKIPQVMVKISGSSKGTDKAQAHLNYIGRKGDVEIEDEEGQKYKGAEQKQLLQSWEAMGMNTTHSEGQRKEAFHIVFSMPKNTNPDAMKTAVKNLVQEEFAGHKYFIAQHLDTDNPHCHVLLAASDDRGARLNPRKADLHNYRVSFVNKLAEQGIEATASRKVHRFKYKDSKRQGVIHRDKRQNENKGRAKNPSISQKQRIDKTHQDILKQYQAYQKSQNSDNKLNAQAVKSMLKQKQRKDKDMDRG